MVNGSRKNKVNNPSHPSRTYMDLLVSVSAILYSVLK